MRSATDLSWMLPRAMSMTSAVASVAGCLLLLLWGKKRYERSLLPDGPKGSISDIINDGILTIWFNGKAFPPPPPPQRSTQ